MVRCECAGEAVSPGVELAASARRNDACMGPAFDRSRYAAGSSLCGSEEVAPCIARVAICMSWPVSSP